MTSMSDPLFRLPKFDVIRLLQESKAREAEATEKLKKLEIDLARKTSDLDLSQRREYEMQKAQSNAIDGRTRALHELEMTRQSNHQLARQLDAEKMLRAQMEQRLGDMRTMLDVVKLVADRE